MRKIIRHRCPSVQFSFSVYSERFWHGRCWEFVSLGLWHPGETRSLAKKRLVIALGSELYIVDTLQTWQLSWTKNFPFNIYIAHSA
jgi:hypothetical protein